MQTVSTSGPFITDLGSAPNIIHDKRNWRTDLRSASCLLMLFRSRTQADLINEHGFVGSCIVLVNILDMWKGELSFQAFTVFPLLHADCIWSHFNRI